MTRLAVTGLALFVAVSSARAGAGDGLDRDATWDELRSEGRSFVFGRIQGRFDGIEYRGRKIRVKNTATGKEHLIRVEKGLGFFEAALPVGTYAFVALEAVYFPPTRPLNPRKYPPVQQSYRVRPLPEIGLPTFPVVEDRPVYLGTIRSGLGGEGLVYEGHSIEIADEFQHAFESLASRHRELVESLARKGIEPTRYFFLKPTEDDPVLDLAAVDAPLEQARDYLSEGKFDQALSWLDTFMPTTDEERTEVRLLVGETYLADKRYEDAIEELGDVLLAEPENLRALRLLARAHALSGHREDALDLYRALADAVPDDAESSLYLGYHYALAAQEELAERAFDSAFAVNFDYLLHDLTPYSLALKADGAEYTPPKIIDGAVRAPSTLRSRRSESGAFGMLLDHEGHIVAVHLTPNAGSWAPTMMMTLIRAHFRPARLNGVPIPCLVIIGADNILELGQ